VRMETRLQEYFTNSAFDDTVTRLESAQSIYSAYIIGTLPKPISLDSSAS
jgi:hypothetical protein